MENNKKVITTTSKLLIWVSVIEFAIIALLVLSGFNQVNPYFLLFTLIVFSGVIIYFVRKPKEMDIFKLKEYVQNKYYQKEGRGLDMRDSEVIQATPEITYLYLPKEGTSFEIRGKLIKGIQSRHVYDVIKALEKSKLFDSSQKYSGAAAKLKQSADALNIDPESLGLE